MRPFIDWRVYWILAPCHLIIGIACQLTATICGLISIMYLFWIKKIELIEIGLLLPWCIIGLYLNIASKNIPEVLSGTVSVVTDRNFTLIADDGHHWKVSAKEFVQAGSWVKIKAKNLNIPVTPRSYLGTNTLRLQEYLEIQENQTSLRHKIYLRCYRNMSRNPASIASALMAGICDMPQQLREDFSNAGLSHILAISGLHIGIICGSIWFVMRRVLGLFFVSSELLSILITILLGGYYAMIAGCVISLLRALLMFILGACAWYNGRGLDPIRICGAVACMLLILYPNEWNSPSFILSFVATASLLCNPYSVQFVTAPYVLYFFCQLPLQPFVSNFLAIPWLTCAVMPVVLVNLLLLGTGIGSCFACLEYVILPLIWIAEYSWSPIFHYGMPLDFSIVIWTIIMIMFFLTKDIKYCITGLICFSSMLYFAEPQGQIVMKYGSNFGLWDGKVLWVSNIDAAANKQWSNVLGNVPIQLISKSQYWNVNHNCYIYSGYTKLVWFGRDLEEAIKSDAIYRVWLKPQKNIQDKYDISQHSVWIWLDSGKIWIGQ